MFRNFPENVGASVLFLKMYHPENQQLTPENWWLEDEISF